MRKLGICSSPDTIYEFTIQIKAPQIGDQQAQKIITRHHCKWDGPTLLSEIT